MPASPRTVSPGPSVTQKATGIPSVPQNAPQTAPETPAAPKCAGTYERKVKGGTVKTYPCAKSAGHEGKHGPVRKPVTAAATVPMAVLETFEAVPGDEIIPIRETDTVRSPEQVKVDGHVKSAHESWVIAGKPKSFNDSPRQRYRLRNRDEVQTVTRMLRKAERLHGNVHVRIAPVSQHRDGSLMLVWVATDARPRANGNQPAVAASKPAETVKQPA